jgi:hypothetical protein
MLNKNQKDYIHGLIRNLSRFVDANDLRAVDNNLESISNIIKPHLERGDTRDFWTVPMSERNTNFSKAHFKRYASSAWKKAKKWKF